MVITQRKGLLHFYELNAWLALVYFGVILTISLMGISIATVIKYLI